MKKILSLLCFCAVVPAIADIPSSEPTIEMGRAKHVVVDTVTTDNKQTVSVLVTLTLADDTKVKCRYKMKYEASKVAMESTLGFTPRSRKCQPLI